MNDETLEHFIERIEPIVYDNRWGVDDIRNKTIEIDHRIGCLDSRSCDVESTTSSIMHVIDSLKNDVDNLNKKLNKVIKFLPDDVKLCLELTDENGEVD